MKKQLLKAPGPASALISPCQLTLALAVITILGLMVFSQALEDQYGQRVESRQTSAQIRRNPSICASVTRTMIMATTATGATMTALVISVKT